MRGQDTRICLQCRRPRFDPWVGKVSWRRAWQPTSVCLPGESLGQRSLYSPWSCRESDMIEQLIHTMSTAVLVKFGGFPDNSVGLESACTAEDPSLIPGLGRSPRERIGYPLQYSWASLVSQLAKNLPAMWETWVQSLGWEDPLEKGKATHSTILAWRITWTV